MSERLTDLIAAHHTWREVDEGGDYLVCACGHYFASRQTWAAHLALVVEQHTNGRIAELEAHAEYMGRELPNVAERIDALTARAKRAEAVIDRVRDALTIGPLHRLNFPKYKDPYAIDRHVIRAALKGEQS